MIPNGDGLTEGLGARGRRRRWCSPAPTLTVLFFGIDPYALHHRQIDDQAIIDAAETRTIVAAAANGDRKLVVPAEIHGRDDIGDIRASRDHQRPLVDHGVIELARLFVFRMVAPDGLTTQTLRKTIEGFVNHASVSSLNRLVHSAWAKHTGSTTTIFLESCMEAV